MKRALIGLAATVSSIAGVAVLDALNPPVVHGAFYDCNKSLTNSGGFSHANIICFSVVDDDAMYRGRAELTRLSDGTHWVVLGPLKDCDGKVSITASWITDLYRVDAYGWRVFDDTIAGGC
jgi:hypothetical protein